mmetsp:Transcript_26995/g.53928  ORF Transcript_26995/g.53928 Transcript_26995/m.53928 type:complete len:88 (+) Transcript_26995:103-366(+)
MIYRVHGMIIISNFVAVRCVASFLFGRGDDVAILLVFFVFVLVRTAHRITAYASRDRASDSELPDELTHSSLSSSSSLLESKDKYTG